MFRVSQHPSSGVLKTVPAASSEGHTTCTATPLQCGLIGTPFYFPKCPRFSTLQTYAPSVAIH